MARRERAQSHVVKLASRTFSRHPGRMLSALGALVRRHDPDRFFTALFAPAERRETLFLLYAFNHELARAREVASQPTLALIRLQWWREVVDGVARRHEVATPLQAALTEGRLEASDLQAMIAAREVEADPAIESFDDWLAYLHGAAGSVAVSAGRILGASVRELTVLRDIGVAYGVAGVLRNQLVQARQGRCLLPAARLQEAGVSLETAIAAPDDLAVAGVRRSVAEFGRSLLPHGQASFFPPALIAAALPAVFARRDLRHGSPATAGRGLPDKLAVLFAAWRRRV